MSLVRTLPSILVLTLAASLTPVFAMSSASAASTSARKPVILDSQNGISDGQSGTVLQTAPLSRQPIVEAQPIATPAELAPNSSIPIVVAPYIQLPTGGGTPPQPQPRPAPRPQPRPQ
ncbi:hypothetical protein DR64_850 [Paraburkholderia xenovorans LB400]|uniref:Uncharacterized protein n=1 Tax=Paraburkholderia xenovorans (strain LB400) TaxID=266265 RepID=Q142C0_PARXL|nr:hypothetical protein [Paraburkholderia xenovorans]ABE29819.1 hypothetical protein Bxe_A3160 [Paraburkholderia xenovorans LB400]AIP32880.1 hypothetical protein DR64_850 [Paraburkholderia xenovorans LB400]